MVIENEEVRILQQLFNHPNCNISNVEMEELEVSDSMSRDVIEAVCGLKNLFAFDFSNNQLPQNMTESIVRMINKYQELEILCLDHCEMTDDISKYVFSNINNTKLQFLNISWNYLSGESLPELVRVVSLN